MTDHTALPEPLTPPECDLTDFPFMPLEVARLRDSELASNETPEACWAAVLLWAASWHQVPAASVPNDDKWLAKAAGYGRVVREWMRVKDGAMRGFVPCTDGRLYHAVVAEKAREAWQSKLRHRWGSECARIKKHNERHHTSIEKPTFEDWLASGCPTGQPLPVPGDSRATDAGQGRDIDSKRQGEGEGQGDSYSDLRSAGAAAPPVVDKSTKPKPATINDPEARRQLWVDSGTWLVSNGMTAGEAKAFINAVMAEFPFDGVAAFREAIKTAAPADARAFVQGCARVLKSKRETPPTVPSDAAVKTAEYLAAQAQREAAPPPSSLRSVRDAIAGAGLRTPETTP